MKKVIYACLSLIFLIVAWIYLLAKDITFPPKKKNTKPAQF